MEKKLLLIGGGGHCRSVLDSVLALNIYDKVAMIDRENTSMLGVKVIGSDKDIPVLFKDGWQEAFITVGSVGNTAIRRRLYQMVKEIGLAVPTITDPSASVAQYAMIKEGVYIGKRAVVNTGAVIGECAIINTGAIIEHDCAIGQFAHVSPGTILCGQVMVGDDTHVGAGAVVRQQLSVGNNVLIGIGSVIVRDIPDKSKAIGNPCKVVE